MMKISKFFFFGGVLFAVVALIGSLAVRYVFVSSTQDQVRQTVEMVLSDHENPSEDEKIISIAR